MNRLVRALLVGLAAAAVTAAPAHADAPDAVASVQISQDTTRARAAIGEPFSFTTTVRNPGDQPLTGLVAHLDIVGLDPDVYVDPEDWSSQRTQYLPPVAPNGSETLSWSVQPVNPGRLVVYVTLVSATGGAVMTGPALHAEVSAQQRLDAAGVLPVAVAVPAVVLILLVAGRVRRRRLV